MFIASGSFFAAVSQDLFDAVKTGNCKAVKRMLSYGVSVNTLNAEGKTVLDVAAERGHFKIARELVGCGAKVTTELNACILKERFKRRARNFFISGFFVTPLLWIGSWTSLSKSSDVIVLAK